MFELLSLAQMTLLYVICAIIFVLVVADICLAYAIAKTVKDTKTAAKKAKSAPATKPKQAKDEVIAANDRFDDQEKPEEEIVAAKEEEKQEEVKEEPAPVEEKKEEPAPVKEEVVVPVEEVKEESAPVEEKKEEPAPVKEKKTEKKSAPVKEKKEEKPVAKKAEKAAPVKEKKEEKPVKKAEKEVAATKEPAKKEPVQESDKKVLGKMEICNSELGGYTYILRANNGQLLYESKTYKTVASCKEASQSFIDAVKVGMFSIRADKFKNYKFILKSHTSNNIIYVGESFDNKSSCQNNIDSVKRFAVDNVLVDSTSADFVAKFKPFVISDEVKERVKKNNGAIGKWAIEQEDEGDKNAPYVFILYANNNQVLYESRDYKTYSNCKSGLETFRKTIQEGEFIIDPDKAGRFKFVLRNKSNNSLMEYIGHSYSTQRACADNIESVYRFALVSPIDKL